MDFDEQRRLRVARQIIDRRAMARGVVVLDENVFGLESALRGANILVVKLPLGLADDRIKKQLLSHRIVITKNPSAFVEDASVYEYGVVALDKLDSIDSAPDYAKNRTAQLISKALSGYGLWAKGAKFLLELHDDGNHVLEELN
jgi:hypothetical protein